MSKFTFICEDDAMPFSVGITTKRTFEFDSNKLNVVLCEFKGFLKSCGYNIDGELQVVKQQDTFETMFTGIHAEQTVTVSAGVDVITLNSPFFNVVAPNE